MTFLLKTRESAMQLTMPCHHEHYPSGVHLVKPRTWHDRCRGELQVAVARQPAEGWEWLADVPFGRTHPTLLHLLVGARKMAPTTETVRCECPEH